MSAFLSIAYADRVELLADGACCFPTGELIAAVDKITVSPHVPMAIVGRGRHTELKRLEETIVKLSSCGSVDTTIALLVDSLSVIAADIGETVDHFEICIACISETAGPSNYYFTSMSDRQGPFGPVPPFTLYDFADHPVGGGPQPSEDDMAAAGLHADQFRDGMADAGLRLMEMMRTMKGPVFHQGRLAGDAYWIGGHVDLATVRTSGVDIERLRTWPDKPLEMIQPAA